MAEYIWRILRSQIIVVFSWGFHNPTALPDDKGLAFQVNGFKYRGMVKVVYNEGLDLFDIHIGDKTIEGIYLDNLVAVIDNEVEKPEDYKTRIETEYGIN